MSQFSLPRFTRVIQNDALRVARPVLFGTLALLGFTVLIYLTNFKEGESTEAPLSDILFTIYLLAGGLLFTSSSFQDMHHPLERYRYLMLPCSNLERFASRYLLTGPLFVLYAVLAFSAVDWVGNLLTSWWVGARQPPFSPFTSLSWLNMRVYLGVHVFMLIGAICFRSHALIRTALSLLALLLGFAVVCYVAVRIVYWDSFSWTSFEAVRPIRLFLMPLFAFSWVNTAIAVGFGLWILYVAYRCLRGHEVQDGL